MNVYDKLEELSITLPEVSPPAAAFVPFVRTGNLIFLAGHIAKKNGTPWSGQLGATISTQQGSAAAREIAIELMATLHAATGNLNNIRRIVKLLVIVNSTPSFIEQHLDVAQIPFGSCVEIQLIAEVADA